MNRKVRYGQIPAGNPLVNALLAVVGVLAVAAVIVLGIVAFVVVASILLVLVGVVAIRVWWFRRKLRKAQAGDSGASPGEGGDTQVIEGEYRTVQIGNDHERRADRERTGNSHGT